MAFTTSSSSSATHVETDDRMADLARRINDDEIKKRWSQIPKPKPEPILGDRNKSEEIYKPTFLKRIFGF